jgi:NAD(P)-dependent dehydrogenase (short-subunit alcohol dehydrogenase family)
LLPVLATAGATPIGARVVCTTSIARVTAGKFDLADLQLRGHYKPWTAYGISKRAMLEFAFELDRRLAVRGGRGFAADPGFSRTDLQRTSADSMRSLQHRFWVAALAAAQSADKGALPQLRAATDPEARGGVLYAPRWWSFGPPVVRRVRGRMVDPIEQAALWDLAERETGMTLE